MTDAAALVPPILDAWNATSQLEVVSVVFGLAYVVLAARENIWCWPAAFIGTGTAVFLFWDASLLMESALNVYYLAMALIGWLQWRYGGKLPSLAMALAGWLQSRYGGKVPGLAMAIVGWLQSRYGGKVSSSSTHSELRIRSWGLNQHLIIFALIAGLTLISGYLLSQNTQAALPYVDSFTTWSAVICTWMIARKVLENWLYWIVIDAVSVWLYVERGLYLYALLFIAYTVIAVFGYFHWRQKAHHAR